LLAFIYLSFQAEESEDILEHHEFLPKGDSENLMMQEPLVRTTKLFLDQNFNSNSANVDLAISLSGGTVNLVSASEYNII
jgi:hypothetical protein